MTDLTALIRDLVVANRILASENVVDAYGHVSVRHPTRPDRFLIATSLAPATVALRRARGFWAAARARMEVVRMWVYVPRKARALLTGLRLGDIKPLSEGEVAARNAGYKPYSLEPRRAWKYWAHKAGCAHLVEDHPIDHQHKPWGAG